MWICLPLVHNSLTSLPLCCYQATCLIFLLLFDNLRNLQNIYLLCHKIFSKERSVICSSFDRIIFNFGRLGELPISIAMPELSKVGSSPLIRQRPKQDSSVIWICQEILYLYFLFLWIGRLVMRWKMQERWASPLHRSGTLCRSLYRTLYRSAIIAVWYSAARCTLGTHSKISFQLWKHSYPIFILDAVLPSQWLCGSFVAAIATDAVD